MGSSSVRFLLLISIIAALPLVLLRVFAGQFYFVADVPSYLVFHNVSEFFSVVVSLSIFGVAWYSHELSGDRHALFLGTIFLSVGLLDFMHVLGYFGMPAFITENSPLKSTQYWMAARLFMALALLLSAHVYPASRSPWLTKPALLMFSLGVPLLAFVAITFFPEYIPRTYIEGVGLTPFKTNAEYLIIGLLAWSAVVYWRRLSNGEKQRQVYFLAALILCILSEWQFASYQSVFDTFNVIGHIYKVAAFYLIYLGIFSSSIKLPYVALYQANQKIKAEVDERQRAEDANRAKSVFLSSMSHELRTPLNAILGFSNLMRRDPLLVESQRAHLDIINRSGEHLLTLINDVLEMAKIEAGRVQLDIAPFDLGAMVRDVTDMMELRAREKGLQLLFDQSSEFPRYIEGDEVRLRQILVNLVGNAIKFTAQGFVTIRLGAKQNQLLLEVEDSGSGISAVDQKRLFQPFVQLGKQAGNQGTGLGLAITRQFVQLMGGNIALESTLGKGSLFRVELPLNEVVGIAEVKQVETGDVTGLAPGQMEYRILIVEDQPENQLLLFQLMERLGFVVKVADNGEQGVQLFQSWQPQLIWMDRRMPVMDGLEATKAIRELPGGKDVKIVAVTASAFKEQKDEMLKAGMDDFVQKPYRIHEIYECLSKHLGVQYVYADAANEPGYPTLTAEMLAVLPSELRRELHGALQSLETKRIAAAIVRTAEYDAKLFETLHHLADNFDYPTILKALQ